MKLVGYKRFESKKGDKYCVANVLKKYIEREVESGCVGEKLEEIFLPDELYDYLTPKDIGKEVKAEYEINRGRAYLTSFVVS